MTKRQIHVGFRDADAAGAARLEIAVPQGTTRADLGEVLKHALPQIEKLRPRGCLSCISGLDINIRERFEHVLTFEV
jgi:hypothetical protein